MVARIVSDIRRTMGFLAEILGISLLFWYSADALAKPQSALGSMAAGSTALEVVF